MGVLLASTLLNRAIVGSWIVSVQKGYGEIIDRAWRRFLALFEVRVSDEESGGQYLVRAFGSTSVTLVFLALLIVGIVNNWAWMLWFAVANLSLYVVILALFFTLEHLEAARRDRRSGLRFALMLLLRIIFTVILLTPVTFVVSVLFIAYGLTLFVMRLPFGRGKLRRVLILVGIPMVFVGMLLEYLNRT